MVNPLGPEGLYNPNPDRVSDVSKLMQVCHETLASQKSDLESLSPTLSEQRIENVLNDHKDALYKVIDGDHTTRNCSQKEREDFVSQQINEQRAFIKHKFSTKSSSSGFKVGASPRFGAQSPSNPLDIDGVSVYVWTAPNGQKLYFPVGHSLQGGNETTPSEAWGYAMRNAVDSGNKTFFQQLVQSYLYFANQSVQYTHLFGLMGWNPNMTTGSYANTSAGTSASDADEDILEALMAGLKKFGNFTINDPVTNPSTPGTYTTIDLHDLFLKAAQSFINGDIGSFSVNGKTYSPALTLDAWGHDALYPDYFDPMLFAHLISFLKSNNSNNQFSSDIQRLTEAARNTMQFVFDTANGSHGWIPNSPYNYPAQPSDFGYDATRILMRLGEFLATPGAASLFGNTMYQQAVTVLKNLVQNIMPDVQNGTFTPSGLTGACFTGPFLLALEALKKIGQLPSDVSQSNIDQIFSIFQKNMTEYDIHDGTSGWQNNGYFNIQLGTLSESIMKELGIYPGT